MATIIQSDQMRILVADSKNAISLPQRADEVLLGYETDDAELTNEQIAKIREAMPQDQAKPVKSSLF